MGCCGFSCAKNALISLNVLYMMVSIILVVVAAYMRIASGITSIGIIGGIISCGVFLFIIAVLGMAGAAKHHQVCLFFYMVLLFIIFLLQFVFSCILLAVDTEHQRRIAEHTWRSSSDSVKKDIMHSFDCCGFDRHSQNLPASSHLGHPPCGGITSKCTPESDAPCCIGVLTTTMAPSTTPASAEVVSSNSSTPAATTTVAAACPSDPCMNKIAENVDHGVNIIGGVSLCFSFTEIIGVFLAYRFRNMKDPRANPNAFL